MRRQRIRFLVVFFVLLVLFEVQLLIKPVDAHVIRPFTQGIAVVSGFVLRAMAQSVEVVGTVVAGRCFSVNINNGCNGVEATLFLAAAILAFPASWRARLGGLAAGFALIQGVNMLRVISLWMIGCYRREWFDTAHLAIWQTVVFSAAILFFLLWTRKVKPVDAPQHA